MLCSIWLNFWLLLICCANAELLASSSRYTLPSATMPNCVVVEVAPHAPIACIFMPVVLFMLSEAATSRRPPIEPDAPEVPAPVVPLALMEPPVVPVPVVPVGEPFTLPPRPVVPTLLLTPVLPVVPLAEAFAFPPTELLPVPVVLRLPLIVSVPVLVLEAPVPETAPLSLAARGVNEPVVAEPAAPEPVVPEPVVVDPVTLPVVPEFMLLAVLPLVSCRICSVVRLVIIPSWREFVVALAEVLELPDMEPLPLPIIDCSWPQLASTR